MPEAIDRPLSLKEVAHMLQFSTKTLERWMEMDPPGFPLPSFLPGGKKFWTIEVVRAWMLLAQHGMFRRRGEVPKPEEED